MYFISKLLLSHYLILVIISLLFPVNNISSTYTKEKWLNLAKAKSVMSKSIENTEIDIQSPMTLEGPSRNASRCRKSPERHEVNVTNIDQKKNAKQAIEIASPLPPFSNKVAKVVRTSSHCLLFELPVDPSAVAGECSALAEGALFTLA